MSGLGFASRDKDDKCPKCSQFIERVEMVAFRVDGIKKEMQEIEKFLAENEWIFIENAEKMKHIRSIDDIDKESFDLTCKEVVRFSTYIDKVKRALKSIDAESTNFARGSE